MNKDLLKQLEISVRDRQYLEVGNALFPILREIEQGAKTISPSNMVGEATRLAAAITQILTDTNVGFPKGLFLEMNRFKRCIVQIYEVSGYGGTGHLLEMLTKTDDKGNPYYLEQELIRLFTGLSINAMTLKLADILLRMDSRWSFPIVLGFLSEQVLYSPQAELVRSKLLESGHIWENLDADAYMLRPDGERVFPINIATAYMGCSYAEAPHKHEIKKCMNKIMRRWLEKSGVRDTGIPVKRALKNRPKLVMFAEVYNPFHAMHRCYGPSIESLKERFETTMVIANGVASPELENLANTVVVGKNYDEKPQELIAKLQSLEPDILYLPSIGMRLSSIAVSNVRIAPIQVMSFGHPATTHSHAMDYAIVRGLDFHPDTVSEKAFLRHVEHFSYAKRTDAIHIPPQIRLDPEVIRIAVPAWSRKVTPRFLETCKRIESLTKKKVEFWFFPNARGYLHQAIKQRYESIFPANAIVLPAKNYNDYIRDLNECDLSLSPFPFGNTNGVVDSLLQGKPVVNLSGQEIHSLFDGAIVQGLNQPSWLTASNIEDYVAAVVRIVNDDALRVQISRNILDLNPNKIFFENGLERVREFVDIMNYIYQHHESIQNVEKKIWSNADFLKKAQNK